MDTFNKTATRPQSGVARPGTAQVPRRNSSAVPEVKNKAYSEYETFKLEYEADVVYTISKDLEEIAE